MCQCGQVGIWQGTQALSLTDISSRISSENGVFIVGGVALHERLVGTSVGNTHLATTEDDQ